MATLADNDPAMYIEHLHTLLRFGDRERPASITAPALVLCGPRMPSRCPPSLSAWPLTSPMPNWS